MALPRRSSAPILRPISPAILRGDTDARSLGRANITHTPHIVDIEMEDPGNGVRRRGGAAAEESDFNPTLTPNSSDEDEETFAGVAAKLSAIQRLLAKLQWTSSSVEEVSIQDSSDINSYIEKVKYEKLEDYAPGIPRLAKLQDSDDSYWMARKFGAEGQRIIIHKQMELDRLFKKLRELDWADHEERSMRYRLTNVGCDKGRDQKQKDLLDEIEPKLVAYYDFLLKYVNIRALTPVPEHNHESLRNWMAPPNEPIEKVHEDFLFVLDDLVHAKRQSGVAKPKNKVDDWLDAQIHKIPGCLTYYLFRDKNEDKKRNDTQIRHTSSDAVLIAGKFIVAIIAIITMLFPIFLMFLLDLRKGIMACIVASFVVVFMVMTILVIDVSAENLFLCIAGYCALLVAILGNTMAQGSGGFSSSGPN